MATDTDTVSEREMVERVAREVMGWELLRETKTGIRWWRDPSTEDEIHTGEARILGPSWNPLHDARHDYMVLEAVRKGDAVLYQKFRAHLWWVWQRCEPSHWALNCNLGALYEPGDYTRAAYEVLTQQQKE